MLRKHEKIDRKIRETVVKCSHAMKDRNVTRDMAAWPSTPRLYCCTGNKDNQLICALNFSCFTIPRWPACRLKGWACVWVRGLLAGTPNAPLSKTGIG